MKSLSLIIFIAFSLISCSSPLDQKYMENQDEETMKEIRTAINGEEMAYMMTSIMRISLSKNDAPSNYTYRELIEKGKEFKAEAEAQAEQEKIIAEKAKQEELERIEKFRSMVSVQLLEKGFAEYSYREYITLNFLILNTSDQNIRAVKGTIVFKDLFDEEIKKVGFTYDDPIPANDKVSYKATLDYNKYISDEQKLNSKDLDDLKVEWVPESIILEDGTVLK